MRVAVVGTGRMGAAMVGRLAAADHTVTVYNRTAAKAAAVAAEHGARHAASAADAVADAEVVLVSMADDAAARAAYGGDEGIVAGLTAATVVADTSTLSPATARELAADVATTGAVHLDAPVSGSVHSVASAALTIMVGGDAEALDRARPAFDTMAARIVHLGANGTGAAMKLAVNSILHALNVALAEGLVLAERAGIDRATAYDVVANSAAGAPFVAYKRDAYLEPDTTPVAFSLDLVAKDLALAADLATELGARVAQLEANRALVADALAEGLAAVDMSALAGYLRSNRD